MGVYVYSERRIENMLLALRHLRVLFCGASGLILAIAAVVAWARPEWIFGAHQHARVWVVAVLVAFVAGPLADNLCRWRSRPARMEDALRRARIEVSPDSVRVSGATARELVRSEVVRGDEVSWGIYLRTANRYRWLLVPEKIGDFDALRRELQQMGIPLVRAKLSPNWEEFAGVFLSAATILCAIFVRNVGVLTVNLGISLLVAVAGFLIVSANPDNLPKMRWARFGVFLPAAMTASMLWLALHS